MYLYPPVPSVQVYPILEMPPNPFAGDMTDFARSTKDRIWGDRDGLGGGLDRHAGMKVRKRANPSLNSR